MAAILTSSLRNIALTPECEAMIDRVVEENPPPLRVELQASRDGEHWTEIDFPVFTVAPPERFDDGRAYDDLGGWMPCIPLDGRGRVYVQIVDVADGRRLFPAMWFAFYERIPPFAVPGPPYWTWSEWVEFRDRRDRVRAWTKATGRWMPEAAP